MMESRPGSCSRKCWTSDAVSTRRRSHLPAIPRGVAGFGEEYWHRRAPCSQIGPKPRTGRNSLPPSDLPVKRENPPPVFPAVIGNCSLTLS
jgi:hypothetical protein